MPDAKRLLFCATDKEIFDAYMSAPQHFNENTLLSTGAERNIFYSSKDDREQLADVLSIQIFSFEDLRKIESYFEKAGRADRRTAISLNVSLSPEELKEVAREIIEKAPDGESIVGTPIGKIGYAIDVAYSELDFGATRFRQRREREANISVEVEEGRTVLRLPATVKARGIADEFVSIVAKNKKKDVPKDEIELSSFSDPDMRNRFFTSLISNLPDSKLENVLRVRVEKLETQQNSDLDDEEENQDAKAEMLSLVRAVALNGESLLTSPEYQSLRKRGFFITSITWHVRKNPPAGPLVEYEAGFDEPQTCTHFRYAVRQWKTKYDTGVDRKSFAPITELSKDEFGKELEDTAVSSLRELREELQKKASATPSGGEA